MDLNRKKRLSRREQKSLKRRRQSKGVSQTTNPLDDHHQPQKDDHHHEPTDLNAPDDTYVPTEIPSLEDVAKETKSKALGKWFPKALVIKKSNHHASSLSDSKGSAALVLFYQYVDPPWSESTTQQLIGYLNKIGHTRILGGRIRVAREGVNATISSLDDASKSSSSALITLQHFARDLRQFHKCFQETDFKFIGNLSADRHFASLKIFPVNELVFYGIDQTDAPMSQGGVHLEPQEFHKKLEDKSTVVVDVRNHYEAAIGRFDGQQQNQQDGGAEYVDPKMRKSTDFTTWLEKPETQAKLEGKQVLLYCTGKYLSYG